MLARLIAFASGSNFTVKLSRDSSAKPRISVAGENTRLTKFKYSSPMLRYYEYPSKIYCFNLERVNVAQTNMWTKYVPIETWAWWDLFCSCYLY